MAVVKMQRPSSGRAPGSGGGASSGQLPTITRRSSTSSSQKQPPTVGATNAQPLGKPANTAQPPVGSSGLGRNESVKGGRGASAALAHADIGLMTRGELGLLTRSDLESLFISQQQEHTRRKEAFDQLCDSFNQSEISLDRERAKSVALEREQKRLGMELEKYMAQASNSGVVAMGQERNLGALQGALTEERERACSAENARQQLQKLLNEERMLTASNAKKAEELTSRCIALERNLKSSQTLSAHVHTLTIQNEDLKLQVAALREEAEQEARDRNEERARREDSEEERRMNALKVAGEREEWEKQRNEWERHKSEREEEWARERAAWRIEKTAAEEEKARELARAEQALEEEREHARIGALLEAAREEARVRERETEIEREAGRTLELKQVQCELLDARRAQALASRQLQELQTQRVEPLEALVEQLKSVSLQHQQTIAQLQHENATSQEQVPHVRGLETQAKQATLRAEDLEASLARQRENEEELVQKARMLSSLEQQAALAHQNAQEASRHAEASKLEIRCLQDELARQSKDKDTLSKQLSSALQHGEAQLRNAERLQQALAEQGREGAELLTKAAQQEELLLSSTTANASLAQELRAADAQLALQRQQLDAALSREEEIKKECEHWQEMLQRKEDELAEERRRFQECVAEQESASKAAAEGFKSREDEIGDLRQQVTVLEASLRESKVKLAVVEVGEADALGRLQREVEDRRAQVSLQEQAHSEALSKHQRAAADMEQQLSRMRQRLEDEGTRLREAQARVDMLQEANKDLQAAAQSACSLQVAVDKKDQQLARSDKIIEKLMADVATLKAN